MPKDKTDGRLDQPNPRTFGELEKKIAEVFGTGAQIETDNYGQIVIYTGLINVKFDDGSVGLDNSAYYDDDGNLLPKDKN